MSQALYRKWRSQSFDELVGQEHVKDTLRNALREGRIAHAYLFSGPRGTGKTSTARILAKALNCTAPEADRPCNQCATCVAITEGRMIDLVEIDAASNNSVDDIRELRDKVGFRPSEGRYKIYIIDEVHMLSTSAFNALLKTLEEPPPHVRFFLATTEPHKIPATILSRCQRFDFRRIPALEIAGHLRHIAEEEGRQTDQDALLAIARASQGCMRDAVSLLDQLLSYGAATLTIDLVQQVLGAVKSQSVTGFVDALVTKNVGQGLLLLGQLTTQGVSLTEFTNQLIDYLRGVMLVQMTGDPSLLSDQPADVVQQMREQAKGSNQPQLPLELALVEMVQGAPIAPAPVIVQQVVQQAAPVVAASTGAAPVETGPTATVAGAGAAAAPSAHAADELPPLDAEAAKRLRARWKEFLAEVKKQINQQVQAALNSVRDMAVTPNSVVLAFGNNDFSRQMVAKPETLPQVTALLSNFLGRSVTIECQLGERAEVVAQRIISVDAVTAGPDPLLAFAVSDLGAQVVE
jgi:DNA polymerase-3 subunit gamma/tau